MYVIDGKKKLKLLWNFKLVIRWNFAGGEALTQLEALKKEADVSCIVNLESLKFQFVEMNPEGQ